MSGPRKMTAAELLRLRGWTPTSPEYVAAFPDKYPDGPCWFDPMHSVDGYAEKATDIATADALTIQRARDAEEERDLYRRTFAACVANAEHFTFNDADLTAQKAVDRYRANFAVEVES